jgi:hypothetical protein
MMSERRKKIMLYLRTKNVKKLIVALLVFTIVTLVVEVELLQKSVSAMIHGERAATMINNFLTDTDDTEIDPGK